LFLAYFTSSEKNNSRLVRLPCCVSVCVFSLTTFECLLETSSPKEGEIGEDAARDLTPVGYSGPDALKRE
jgi:hypothetical protein